MSQPPTQGRRTQRARQRVYDGEGEQLQVESTARAPRRQSVTQPRTAPRQPLGRSEELQQRQRVYQQAYRQSEPQERLFRQPVQDDTVYDDFDIYDRGGRVYSTADRPRRRDPHRGLWGAVVFLCFLCVAAIGMFLAPQLLGIQYATMPNCAFVNGSVITLDQERYESYKTYRRYMNSGAIYPGVFIDGVDVGGMTPAEALSAVGQVSAQGGGEFAITVNVGNKSWCIDSSQVPMTRNAEAVVSRAYALGRGNTTAIRGTRVTPFQERLNSALSLRTTPAGLYTELTYDRASIRQLTDSIAQFVNRDPVNASVATFDFNTRSFTFNSDSPGSRIDADVLYSQVTAALDGGSRTATITMEPEILLAPVTKAELMNSFRRISTYTTSTTSNSNRNTNVSLSAQAINGTTVMPGEIFSFNAATGQRTEEKGYKAAAAISGGQSVDEIGGGVCQTSSTLFNAVARANLEIIERSPHAWPSNYVEKGMDATVNWPNLDFKFRNNTDWPIFIVSYYSKQKVTVEIYGMSLGDGITIDLVSEVTKTIAAPTDINYVQNTSLPAGTQKTTVQARKGYEVSTYQVWYQNGTEIRRELLCTSKYRAYQQTIEYN